MAGQPFFFARVDFGISSAEGNDGSESTLAGPFPIRQESVVYPRMWTLSRPPAAMCRTEFLSCCPVSDQHHSSLIVWQDDGAIVCAAE